MTGEPTTARSNAAEAGTGEPATLGEPAFPVGSTVRDTARDRIGVVMDDLGHHLQLRPLDGGREWDADPERVEPVGPREVLRARVAEANHHSSKGTWR